ncbi:CHAD domain-containing protein [Streptomyces sp. NA04227]|uniref:CHAD domain-containing protein n=1 Tax=Streptomyces sp. NA04227 TaxID=2742136 RepID=UPI0020CA4B05|nr:CHAD domain-containing protein [Streptomyces sp. NA04227]
MAQQHHDVAVQSAAGDVLSAYLQGQATEFLRSLRLHRENGGNGGSGDEAVAAARALRASARRIGGTLLTFKSLLDGPWSDELRPELAWLSGTLAREYAYADRLERLLGALHRLSGSGALHDGGAGDAERAQSETGSTSSTGGAGGTGGAAGQADGSGRTDRTDLRTDRAGKRDDTAVRARSATARVPAPARREERTPGAGLTVGAAKAGALLERQLTLARTRAHSAALQALGSARFHAVADGVAVLASEVPIDPNARTGDLQLLAREAEGRLNESVEALPLYRAGLPYNSEALVHGLSADPGPQPQDAPWHHVRLLLRLHRYAREVLHGEQPPGPDLRLLAAGRALTEHRDAAEAASAAASAARTPRIAPATAYALGVLHADQRHEVEAARYAFHQAWLKEPVAAP